MPLDSLENQEIKVHNLTTPDAKKKPNRFFNLEDDMSQIMLSQDRQELLNRASLADIKIVFPQYFDEVMNDKDFVRTRVGNLKNHFRTFRDQGRVTTLVLEGVLSNLAEYKSSYPDENFTTIVNFSDRELKRLRDDVFKKSVSGDSFKNIASYIQVFPKEVNRIDEELLNNLKNDIDKWLNIYRNTDFILQMTSFSDYHSFLDTLSKFSSMRIILGAFGKNLDFPKEAWDKLKSDLHILEERKIAPLRRDGLLSAYAMLTIMAAEEVRPTDRGLLIGTVKQELNNEDSRPIPVRKKF